MQKGVNKLCKALVYGDRVSLSVLNTTALVNDGIKIHSLADEEGKTLGEMLTVAAYMAGCLKSEKGAISLSVKSGDGSATACVSGDFYGHIRGYIEDGKKGLKGGTLTVIKDDGFFRPFVGVSELKSQNISQNLMEYFDMSEQIPTAVAVEAEVKDGVCLAAGGVIMQLLPGSTKEDEERAEEAMQSLKDVLPLIKKLDAEGIVERYFPEKKDLYYTLFPEYRCNCSRRKMESILLSLGEDELNAILAEQGQISIHCHYCNKDYVFKKSDINNLISKG